MSAPGRTVLVVEDDETQRLALAWALDDLVAPGTTVDQASDLSEAARMLATYGPDRRVLMICDAHLPDGSGIKFAASVRRRGVHVVVLTASPALQPAHGIDVHQKPVGLAEQRQLVKRLLDAWQDDR